MVINYLQDIVRRNKNGEHCGVYSCCSANYYVIKAVLKKAKETGTIALIEATSNQVNQDGGYTGMTPYDFKEFVLKIASEVGLDKKQIVLGGDHMGPLPWSKENEFFAMEKAKELVRQCILAGYQKIHLDTSMLLGNETKLTKETIAMRGAILAKEAEKAFSEYQLDNLEAQLPVYVVGSEVPVPGGVRDSVHSDITTGEDCISTLDAYKKCFYENGLESVYERIIAIVVHLGVEFKETEIDEFDEKNVKSLVAAMKDNKQIAFEGHSTDYQTRTNLSKMVDNNVAVLKVGPALTFALREALFALDCIEREMIAEDSRSNIRMVIEERMLHNPCNWNKYYYGSENELKLLRSFSYLDRIRYYLPQQQVQDAIQVLFRNLREIPIYLISQYMPRQYEKIREGILENNCEALILDKIGDVIEKYLMSI